MPADSPWLAFPAPNPRAKLRLLCFPYAGGGPTIFHGWPSRLPGDVEVCSIYLPGRGARLADAPFTRIFPLVQALVEALAPYLTKPFALFGHSLGALLSFELARQLRRQQGPAPVRLFVSGRVAPQLPDPRPCIHELPEPEFIEELRSLNGTPREVLEQPDLMRLLVPALRADFAVYETYTYTDEPPLECPIAAFGGLDDQKVSRRDLEAWQVQTCAAASVTMLPGGHFFLSTGSTHLLRALSEDLSRSIRSTNG